MRLEPFVESTSWWHLFPVDITFTMSIDVNLELGLESTKIVDL